MGRKFRRFRAAEQHPRTDNNRKLGDSGTDNGGKLGDSGTDNGGKLGDSGTDIKGGKSGRSGGRRMGSKREMLENSSIKPKP